MEVDGLEASRGAYPPEEVHLSGWAFEEIALTAAAPLGR